MMYTDVTIKTWESQQKIKKTDRGGKWKKTERQKIPVHPPPPVIVNIRVGHDCKVFLLDIYSLFVKKNK